jgi:hypothetical protein
MDESRHHARGTTRRDFLKAGGALGRLVLAAGCAVDHGARSDAALPAAGTS